VAGVSGPARADAGLRQAPAGVPVELSDRQLEQLADLVAERLGGLGVAPGASDPERVPSAGALVDAVELAARLNVSRAFVYEHAHELGVVRLGDGTRARLRFDESTARAALSRYTSERSQGHTANGDGASEVPAPRRRRSLASRRPEPGTILPSRPLASVGEPRGDA
jgi:hypothetical protein